MKGSIQGIDPHLTADTFSKVCRHDPLVKIQNQATVSARHGTDPCRVVLLMWNYYDFRLLLSINRIKHKT